MSENLRGPYSRLGVLPSRRLITDVECQATGMSEFFDLASKKRVIHIPDGSDAANDYMMFLEGGLSLLPASQGADGGLDLIVPSGAQTIQQALKSISTDTELYSPLFQQLGKQLRLAEDLHYGFLPLRMLGRTVLAGVGFAPTADGDGSFKNTVFFIPPYTLSKDVSVEDSHKNIRHELQDSRHFSEQDIVRLQWALLMGFGEE